MVMDMKHTRIADALKFAKLCIMKDIGDITRDLLTVSTLSDDNQSFVLDENAADWEKVSYKWSHDRFIALWTELERIEERLKELVE